MIMVSTLGTSVLANALEPAARSRLFKLANLRKEALSPEDATFLDEAADRAKQLLTEADERGARRLSAELNGIIGYENESDAPRIDQHILVATDTAAGTYSAEIVEEKLRRRGGSSATSSIYDIHRHDHQIGKTGGLRFGKRHWLLGIETSIEKKMAPYLGGRVQAHRQARDAHQLRARLEDIDRLMLSEYGSLLYLLAWDELAARSLLEPIDDRLRFSKAFRHEAEKLPPARLRQTNEAFEAFRLRAAVQPQISLAGTMRLRNAGLLQGAGDAICHACSSGSRR